MGMNVSEAGRLAQIGMLSDGQSRKPCPKWDAARRHNEKTIIDQRMQKSRGRGRPRGRQSGEIQEGMNMGLITVGKSAQHSEQCKRGLS